MKPMMYRGYAARIEYSDEDACFAGRVAGIRDIISFHGDSVDEVRQAFQESIDDYLETAERIGMPAQKPYSGKLMLRLPPDVHAHAAKMAEAHGKSLNAWAEVLARAE